MKKRIALMLLTALLCTLWLLCLTACDDKTGAPAETLPNAEQTPSGGDKPSGGDLETPGKDVEPSHTHFLHYHGAINATCTSKGSLEYWQCTDCRKCFSDAKATNEIIDESLLVIAKLDHSYGVQNSCVDCGKTLEYTWDLEYTINDDGKTYSVSGIGQVTASSIVIPFYYNGKPITGISEAAFRSCRELTEIKIPSSVISIGVKAFARCGNLNAVSFEGQGQSISIGEEAFSQCTGLTTIEMPAGVTSIGEEAFSQCTGLTAIKIPSSVTNIGERAFYRCTALEEIVVEEKNTVYRSSGNCLIETASKSLIWGCQSSVIPKDGSVMSIGENAFYSCYGLVMIDIPFSVTSIDDAAFSCCNQLIGVYFDENSQLERIGKNAFLNCTELFEIEIPSSVKSIGEKAFSNCTGLYKIIIRSGSVSVHETAFDGCTGIIQKVNGVSYVDKWIVDCETSTTEVTLRPDTIGIGNAAFRSCYRLTTIEIPDSVMSIGSDAFVGCRNMTTVVLGENSQLTSIGESAFRDCASLSAIKIPSNVTSLHSETFSGCKALTMVSFGEKSQLTSIGEKAFNSCSNLVTLEIPSGVTNIGKWAFSGCTCLTAIEIPSSVMSISERAFSGCAGLTSMTVENGNAVYHSAGNCLIETASKTLIAGCQNSVIPTDGSVTMIGAWAFPQCDSLVSIVIPSNITVIGDYAFYGCLGMTTIEIPSNITSIGCNAFAGCSGLTAVWFAENSLLTSFGNATFYNCKSLTTIAIPSGVTSIGSDVFARCGALTSIVIPASVANIEQRVLINCDNLTIVYYGGNASDWSNISIDDDNSNLIGATRYDYSENEPTEDGNYWHYVDGVATPWEAE